MGFQKIAQMRAELTKQLDAVTEMVKAAEESAETYKKIDAQYKKLDEQREAQWRKVNGLKTLGVRQLEDYKKLLLEDCGSWGNPVPPTGDLHNYIAEQRRGIDDAVQTHLNKLAASFPSQVAPGMKFREGTGQTVWEVKQEFKAPDLPVFRGKTGPFYMLVNEQGKTLPTNLQDLKTKYKYIKI